VTPREAALAAVEEVLADHPEVASRRLDEGRWAVILPGEVRQAIPAAVEVGDRSCTVTSFLMRGPRAGAARLHEVLLRKNLGANRVRFCLDADGDVVLLARLPLAGTTAEELESVLGEILGIGDQSFEPLVHLGYPGVFPPLRRPAPPPAPGGPGEFTTNQV
jgi:hypothetical protein